MRSRGYEAAISANPPASNDQRSSNGSGAPPSTTFNVYRAVGTCASPGTFGLVGSALAGSPFTDNTVSGGTTYAYHVRGVDSTGGCESAASSCVQATATGTCTLPPTFAGLASATNQAGATCGIDLAWSAATAACAGPVNYNVYRSTTAGFTPAAGNLLAGGVTGTGYTDASATLASGTTYYYIVRAVDTSNSAQESNTVTRNAAPTGPIASSPGCRSRRLPRRSR